MKDDPLEFLLGGPDELVVPRPEFADELLERLLVALTENPTSSRSLSSQPPTASIGQTRWMPPGPIVENVARKRSFARPLATLALVLLVAVSVAIATRTNQSDGPGSIPAAVQPSATPSPQLPIGTPLLDLTLPAGVLPEMVGGGSTLFQFTIPVDASWVWTAKQPEECCHGVVLDYVISGEYSVTFSDEPVQVIRSDGSSETVPAGVALTLGRGDALVTHLEYAHEGTNSGSTAVQLLRWDFVGTATSALVTPSTWIVNADDSRFFVEGLRDGSVTISIRSVRLNADEAYQVKAGIADDLVFVVPRTWGVYGAAGGAHVANVGEGRILNFGDASVLLYVLTVEPGET